MKDNRFRLEYHEGQGNFHMEWLHDVAHARKANTNEWETIATDITSRQGLDFIEKMEEKYKGLSKVSAWGLRQEFAYFTGHPKALTTDNHDRAIGFAQWMVDEGWSLHAQMGESYGKLSKVFGPPHLEYRPAKELYDDYLKELKDIDFASYCSKNSDGRKSAEELYEDYVESLKSKGKCKDCYHWKQGSCLCPANSIEFAHAEAIGCDQSASIRQHPRKPCECIPFKGCNTCKHFRSFDGTTGYCNIIKPPLWGNQVDHTVCCNQWEGRL